MIAILMYMKDEDKNKFMPFYDSMPIKIRDFLIRKRKPFLKRDEKIGDWDITYITLPLSYGDKKSDYKRWHDIIENSLDILDKQGITGAVLPEDDIFFSPVPVFRGRVVNALLTFETSKKAIEKKNISLAKAEFTVVDGDDELTLTALKSLSENVNHLSILTDRESFFDDIKEEAESERGLIITTFASPKNQILKDSDVLVNCSSDMENQDYYYKRNSIYIDLAKNTAKSLRIARKREDMLIIDGIGLNTDKGFFKSKLYEALLYDNNKVFRKYFDEYKNFYDAYDILKENNTSLSSLYFIDKFIL